MKKLIPSLAIMGLLGVMLVPMMASAQAGGCNIRHAFTVGGTAGNTVVCTVGHCTFGTISADDAPQGCSQCCVLDVVYTVTDWVFFIVLGLAIIFIIVAAINFITAGGSPEKAATARQMLIYAAIGIIVALLAKALPFIIKSILNLG